MNVSERLHVLKEQQHDDKRVLHVCNKGRKTFLGS
jgi:hypothetical protein